jgi:hypothetical protein
MNSRLRAAFATVFAVLSFAFVAVEATAVPAPAHSDCFRPCRF